MFNSSNKKAKLYTNDDSNHSGKNDQFKEVSSFASQFMPQAKSQATQNRIDFFSTALENLEHSLKIIKEKIKDSRDVWKINQQSIKAKYYVKDVIQHYEHNNYDENSDKQVINGIWRKHYNDSIKKSKSTIRENSIEEDTGACCNLM